VLPASSSAPAASGAGIGSTQPRGIRNNNPGNIRHVAANAWLGLANPPSDGAFCIFTEAKWGIRAMARLFRNYQRNNNLHTVEGVINRWAPPIENNTSAYVNHVARALKVSPSDRIDLSQESVMLDLVKVVTLHENGINPYSDEQFLAGIRA
jgi:hypothetical protein